MHQWGGRTCCVVGVGNLRVSCSVVQVPPDTPEDPGAEQRIGEAAASLFIAAAESAGRGHRVIGGNRVRRVRPAASRDRDSVIRIRRSRPG